MAVKRRVGRGTKPTILCKVGFAVALPTLQFTWAYDSMGRVLSRTLPLDMTETFVYDSKTGNLNSKRRVGRSEAHLFSASASVGWVEGRTILCSRAFFVWVKYKKRQP
jgi:hypothetical protein